MKTRAFDEWLNKFRASISTYDYYVDFEKVHKNVEDIKIELNILNSLIGSKNIKEEFVAILQKYPETLKVIPILLAKRESEIYCQDDKGGVLYKFSFDALKGEYRPNSHKFKTYEQYCYFMEQTGLFDLLENHLINNLVDYVTGVETGLDSNGRKNRGGHLMEDLVERYIKEAGFVKDETYFKEMYLADIERKWGIDLSALSNQGKAAKRFDFVVKTENMIYAIETNFYASGGSKLNETARSYKMLAQETHTVDGFEFVWFTDGLGWKSARGNLRETFDSMEHIYSIDDLENAVVNEIFK
ncbi:type II restriction endonuclease [Hornefia butyriciproducens]|uniref:type II restriction endonuclease n=1 Tax=Hornefia butyriciproducens TaxID=2652293 RepID=UPI003F8B67F7